MQNIQLRLRKFTFISLFFTILLIPLPILISSHEDNPELPKIPNPLLPIEGSLQRYLFSYQQGEERLIEEFFVKTYHRVPSYFQNLYIGMISLTQEEQSLLRSQNSILSSRLHLSKQIQFLPPTDELITKKVSNIKQSNFDQPSSIVNASVSYENGFDGEGVKIAILDSGIDGFHPDFPNIFYEESFVTSEYGYSSNESVDDLHGHGSHVAGIAAGSGESFPGVAYSAQLLNLKVADMFGGATEAGLIAAINRSIAEHVDVISISMGFDLSTPFDTEDILTQAVNSAVDKGISVVISAGNEATEPAPYATIGSPASASKVITVGASNGSENVVSFSSQGPSLNFRVDPDIVAPGYQIVGPLAYGGVLDKAYNAIVGITIQDYIVLSGTSMSAPVVSGAVALLKQQFPDASPHALRAALLESADDLGGIETIYTQGNGLINVGKAADLLSRSKTSSGYELISSLPRASDKPIEFFHPLVFPGDKSELRLSFMTGSEGTITWEISESLDRLIEFDITPTILSSAGYFEKDIKIKIPFNIPLGEYSGFIRYTAFEKSYDLPIEFTVQKPNATIYWDSYHTGRDDSFLYNYRYLDEILQGESFKYDVNDHFTTISGEFLSQSDILVLTDLEHSMSEEELSIIKDFHDNNGSILLITSYFPYFNPDPYNKLISLFNAPLNLTDQTPLIEYVDTGRDRETITHSLDIDSFSWDDSSPF
ncbi:MAG: S8 family peptidase, partial [Candidatus Hodarchaeales archaeon]